MIMVLLTSFRNRNAVNEARTSPLASPASLGTTIQLSPFLQSIQALQSAHFSASWLLLSHSRCSHHQNESRLSTAYPRWSFANSAIVTWFSVFQPPLNFHTHSQPIQQFSSSLPRPRLPYLALTHAPIFARHSHWNRPLHGSYPDPPRIQ